MDRVPLAGRPGGATPLSQTAVDAIARAKTGIELKVALNAANPRAAIDQHAINGISDGVIGATGVNAPFFALKKAATKQALVKYMDDATDGRRVSAIARAVAGAPTPTLQDAIRAAITKTTGLELFTVDATVLNDAAIVEIQNKAIAKHNELMLSNVIERALDDKQLLDRFIAADNAARRILLNDEANKLKFGVELCVRVGGNFTVDNLPDAALDKVKQSAERKRRDIDNPANLDRRELRQRLNIAIKEGDTPYGYTCKHVTDPAEIASVKDKTFRAAGAGGFVAIGLNQDRVEAEVKVNDLTTWAKSAAVSGGAPVEVVVVREPNGTMRTTNPAAELTRLTTEEKINLAKQMAVEFIANMTEDKAIYIKCGDPELGKMVYAALLVIQMQAAKEKVATIAEMEIFPPAGVQSLRDSWDRTKKKFIEAALGDTQENLAPAIARPSIDSYTTTSEKMEEHDRAQVALTQATKSLKEVDPSASADFKRDLIAAKDRAAEAAAKEKVNLLASEVEKVGTRHKP